VEAGMRQDDSSPQQSALELIGKSVTFFETGKKNH
jgi:hypothetical protein